MQAAIGNVVCTSPLCRSDAYQFGPLPNARLCSEGRRIQSVSGRQSSPGLSLRPSCQSSDCAEKVDWGIQIIKPSENSESTWNVGKNLALLGSGGITFWTAAAVAEEIVVDASGQGGEVAADTVLSFLFTAAFVGLSILTIGVIYLSVSDFLEKRERDAMAKTAGSDKEKLGAPVTQKGDRLMPKGFGKKVEKVEKEKKVEQKS
ncbi:hypothetical protein Mapa_011329 [Marchantia paleacea]|nr:hypothetical protein Mapa_011329 [Marchantia paleacea]